MKDSVLTLITCFIAVACGSDSFDWRAHNGVYLVTSVKTYRGLPGCPGAESVFATTSMLADRLAILQPMEPKVALGDQILLNCLDVDDICANGADIETILKYIKDNKGLPDRTCLNYRAVSDECTEANICVNCLPAEHHDGPATCNPRKAFFKYPIDSYSKVKTSHIRKEVKAHGPVVCEFKDGSFGTIVAYNKNSFTVKRDRGVAHGERGFDNAVDDDVKQCFSAKVKKPYRYYVEDQESSLYATPPKPSSVKCSHRESTPMEDRPSLIISEMRRLSKEDLPKSFSWKDKGLITPMQSHHNGPAYCGACWTMASSATFSDRMKILTGGRAAPDIFVAPQHTIDCVKRKGCDGGDAHEAFGMMATRGTVDETCDSWLGTGDQNRCGRTGCRECDSESCSTVSRENFKTYYAEEYGHLSGEEAMMNEIYHRGPIDCGIASESALREDLFGDDIICDQGDPTKWEIDHDISVVGWGEDAGKKYWIIRNSWGTHWGENGFARVCRGENGPFGNMLLEKDCSWVTPKI